MSTDTRVVLGLMSGTSMDAIDVACLITDGQDHIEQGPAGEFAYLPQERECVRAVLGKSVASAEAVSAVTDAHIRAVAAFMQTHPQVADRVELIGFHGQTIFHDPANRMTVQIGDAQQIASHFGVATVHDFRSADVAAGGEGAPFAPLYHRALSAGIERPFCVLNLGGVGNLTWIGPGEQIMAFDTGPANAMIDDLMLNRTDASCDVDGQIARSGQVDIAHVTNFMRQPYFSRRPPKSLDRNDLFSDVGALSLSDAAATLSEFTVESVAASVSLLPEAPVGWIVTGGGRKNTYLMDRLRDRLGVAVEPVEAAGWDGDALEAQCFAWLAVRSQLGLPMSLPETTRVPAPMTGGKTAYPAAAAISARRRST